MRLCIVILIIQEINNVLDFIQEIRLKLIADPHCMSTFVIHLHLHNTLKLLYLDRDNRSS